MGYNNGITLKSLGKQRMVKSDFLAGAAKTIYETLWKTGSPDTNDRSKKNGLPILSSLHLTHDSWSEHWTTLDPIRKWP